MCAVPVMLGVVEKRTVDRARLMRVSEVFSRDPE